MTLDDLVKQLKELKDEKDTKEELVKDVNRRIEEVQGSILSFLESAGISNAKTPFGSVGIREFKQVPTPKTPEDKALFRAWLIEKFGQEGADALYSVNSTSLKAIVTREITERIESGNLDGCIPGISEITSYNTISYRSK